MESVQENRIEKELENINRFLAQFKSGGQAFFVGFILLALAIQALYYGVNYIIDGNNMVGIILLCVNVLFVAAGCFIIISYSFNKKIKLLIEIIKDINSESNSQ